MKFAVAALMHETNTYADNVSGLTERHHFTVRLGPEILGLCGVDTYTGGILDECLRRGIEIVPIISAAASPSGTIRAEVYQEFKDAVLRGLIENPDIDAVVLELHGAGVSEGIYDLEGDLIVAIRDVVGNNIPVTAALDLHGNITPTMAESFTALLGNHLYPHTDCGERGSEAVAVAVDAVLGKTKPVTELVSLPILLPLATTDSGFPAADMLEFATSMEKRQGVIDCTVFHGFPYSDTPHVGVHIVCTTDNDRELAHTCATEVAAWIWNSRDRFLKESHSPDSAMRAARVLVDAGRAPIVINDTSDNPGGGSPGDGTHLLAAMIEHQIPGSAFAMLCDPEAVQEVIKAGVGNKIDFSIGGRHGPLHGSPLKVSAKIRTITDGRITLTHMMRGLKLNLGPSVGIKVGDVDIVITSRPQQTFDAEIFKLHGINPDECSVIGLKSAVHFRACFRDTAAEILTADSPGLTTVDVTNFDHLTYEGKLWPSDATTEWIASHPSD